MSDSGPGIGLVVDSDQRAQALRAAMMRSGIGMAFTGKPAELTERWAHAPRSEVEAWVVDLSAETEWPAALDELIGQGEVPVLISDADIDLLDPSDLRDWAERLLVKTGDMLACVQTTCDPAPVRRSEPFQSQQVGEEHGFQVWVLAASLGGPPAVKQFLDTLPTGIPAAFVYAQHTDRNFQATLSRLLGRHSGFEMVLAEDKLQLRPGLVVMLPVESAYGFDPSGITRKLDHAWQGPYTPCVDQVISSVAEAFAPNAGAIIFSGMGEDGSVGAREMAGRGGDIWIQEPASCACSSMPEEAAKAVPGGYRGNPEQLARHLAACMKRNAAVQVRASAG